MHGKNFGMKIATYFQKRNDKFSKSINAYNRSRFVKTHLTFHLLNASIA